MTERKMIPLDAVIEVKLDLEAQAGEIVAYNNRTHGSCAPIGNMFEARSRGIMQAVMALADVLRKYDR